MKAKYKLLYLSGILLLFDFLFIKNPVTEYFEIRTGSTQQLKKKLLNLKYRSLWKQQSFSLIGDESDVESTIITLEKDKLQILNRPFSTSTEKVFLHLHYSRNCPAILVSFYLNDSNPIYFYQKDPESADKSVSINEEENKDFIERTSQLSVNDIMKDIKNGQDDFLNSLNFVKNKRLEKLRLILGGFIVFFSMMNFIIIKLVSRIFKRTKIVKDEK